MEKSRKTLFLDFDGVLCDSIDECYVSSWLVHSAAEVSDPASWKKEIAGLDPDIRATFERYRPFIRRGADYVLLQRCISFGVRLGSQEDFDREERKAGAERMDVYHRSFYEVRKQLLDVDRRYWVALNKPYPGVVSALAEVGGTPEVHIISTKRSEYIAEILASWGVPWPTERIHYSGREDKGSVIHRVLGTDNGEPIPAILVDDQIDHLRRLQPPTEGRLASWGYVKPEWLEQREVPLLDLDGLTSLLAAYAERRG